MEWRKERRKGGGVRRKGGATHLPFLFFSCPSLPFISFPFPSLCSPPLPFSSLPFPFFPFSLLFSGGNGVLFLIQDSLGSKKENLYWVSLSQKKGINCICGRYQFHSHGFKGTEMLLYYYCSRSRASYFNNSCPTCSLMYTVSFFA